MGSGQLLAPVGVAVAPLPLATASCVLSSASPESDEVALVGHGFDEADGREAGTRCPTPRPWGRCSRRLPSPRRRPGPC